MIVWTAFCTRASYVSDQTTSETAADAHFAMNADNYVTGKTHLENHTVSIICLKTLQYRTTFIPDICHIRTDGVCEERISHVEIFQISIHLSWGEIWNVVHII